MALFDHEQATVMLWRLHPGKNQTCLIMCLCHRICIIFLFCRHDMYNEKPPDTRPPAHTWLFRVCICSQAGHDAQVMGIL